ncbi:MAG: hypothetical protein AAGF95_12535 [Chloroflexota bacterium]
MSTQYTHQVEVYTTSLVVSGAYDLPIYRPVSDAFNGEQRRYIPLRDATVAPLERSQQSQRVPHLFVDRSEALLVTTLEEATPPDNYVPEEQIRGIVPVVVMFFTTAFVVRATFRKRPDLSLVEALERIVDDFVPLHDVQIFPLLSSFPPLTRATAALARNRVVALYQLAEGPLMGGPPPTPIAEEPDVVEEFDGDPSNDDPQLSDKPDRNE